MTKGEIGIAPQRVFLNLIQDPVTIKREKNMQKPPQKIALVANGSVVSKVQLEAMAQALASDYGAELVYGKECHEWTEPALRAQRFLAYCQDPSVGVLWSIRGGEGSADMLPFIHEQKEALRLLESKTLIGFSDFTPILNYFAQELGWNCIHGKSGIQFAMAKTDTQTNQKTKALMSGESTQTVLNDLEPLNQLAEQSSECRGALVGGNLSLLQINFKDVWEIDTRGKIIFVEDWMEKGYRVNRSLKYLKRVGFFEGAAALILGDFLAAPLGNTPEEQKVQADYLNKMISHFARDLNIPVYQSTRFGHGQANDPLPMGVELKIQASKLVF